MESNSSNTINRKYSLGTLPEEIQFIFNNEMITNSVLAMKELHTLSGEQVANLENEIALTLLGLEFVSSFESRAKTATAMTDERLGDLLEDAAGMLFTPDIMALLNEMETAAKKSREVTATSIKETLESTSTPQPGITVNPPEPIVPSDKVATLRDLQERPKKEIPTGKMVGLAKEETESAVKGMRTMRGDINRLRGPENETSDGSNFTKPFRGN